MSPRKELQLAYELAVHPARLNEVWNRVNRGPEPHLALIRAIGPSDNAFLHQPAEV
jgi:hypothetical protein